jgi:adenylate cyclase
LRCAACGTEPRATARYCDACGARLSGAAPGDYTPRFLTDRVLARRSALEGEHKQVTVLFVDVKGSMRLADSLELEEWHLVMDRFFAIVSEAIHGAEGTINQFTGDGVMALFGAPVAHEDHAQRACIAALRLREEVRRYAGELAELHGIDFSVRMGLSSGPVVVGRIGDDLRRDYTAQGRTVGLAARMEHMAEAWTIYLAEDTAGRVAGFFRLRDLGLFDVKGAGAPVRVFELLGHGELKSRFDAARARGLTRFVGRREELDRLEAWLRDVESGSGRLAGVVGEAGVGKSRLCFEFSARCRRRGVTVRLAQAVAHGEMVPFLPLLELLRGVFGIGTRDAAAEARRKISEVALRLEPQLAARLPLFFEFLGVAGAEAAPPRLDPEEHQRRLIEAVMDLVRASARREPVVFLVEDLHWLDPASQEFLSRLAELTAEAPVLLLVNTREGTRPAWMERPDYDEIRLEPLGEAAVEALLDALLGSDPSTAALRGRIHEITAGNPFFVEELVQSLLERGALEHGPRGLRLARPLERLEVPPSLQAVLAARIDRLDELPKQALQAAAVIGQLVPAPLLERVLGLPGAELRAALSALVASRFLIERGTLPDAVYEFRHPLTLEVAYEAQLQTARAHTHAAVATALAELYPARLDESAALLARHAEQAGRPLDAARWHTRAARWVGSRDVRAAFRHWRTAQEQAARAPASVERTRLSLDADVWIQQVAWRLGLSKEETTQSFSRGVALGEECGDPAAVMMLALGYAVYRGVIGDEEGQYRYGSEAASLADASGSLPLALAARVVMATSLHFQGRVRDALAVADWAVARRPDDPASETARFWISPFTYILGLRGLLRSLSGRFEAGRRDLDAALELAREIDDAEALGCVHGFHVQHARCAGEAGEALAHARQMVDVAEKTGIPLLRVDGYLSLGSALSASARWDAAASALERALEIVESRRILLGQRRRILAALAEVHLGRGRHREAAALAGELLAERQGSPRLLVELSARLVEARCLLREGSGAADAVHRALAEAVELVEKSGSRALEPEIHRVLAELAHCEGDAEARLRHLRAARRLYREMAATGHAERLSALLD